MPTINRHLLAIVGLGLHTVMACGDARPSAGPTAQAEPTPNSTSAPTPAAMPEPAPTGTPDVSPKKSEHHQLSAACQDFGPTPTDPPDVIVKNGGGTDVSAAQGDVPWRTLAIAKLAFVYIKATESTTIVDPKFAQNWRMAKACGIPRGAYHVIHPSKPADAQAQHYLEQLAGDYGEMPPVIDIEVPTKKPFPAPAQYVDSVTTWLQQVEQASGHQGMLYFEHWYYRDILGASPKLGDYRLWAAQYSDMPEDFTKWPWSFWQHDQPVSWADRQWDQDRFNGTADQLAKAIADGWK